MSANGNGSRLVGWKAIGYFLRCTERTARRWEIDRALPVHRVPGGGRSSVWANSDELTLWLETLPSDALTDLGTEEDIGIVGAPPAPARDTAGTIADAPPTIADTAAVEPTGVSGSWRRVRWVAPVAAVVLVALAVAGVTLWKSATRVPQPPSAGSQTPYGDNREASDLFMSARFELSTRTADGLTRAEHDFRRLVEIYPLRAAAWSGLADTYLLLREFGSMTEEAAYPQAAQAARTAIALDPRLADAWLDQAFVAFWWEGNANAAFHAFETALQLDPTSAKAFHWYGNALVAQGEFTQSLQMMARARALDPASRAIVADEGWLRFIAGQQEEGLATLERMVQIDPKFVSWHSYLSRAYLVRSRDVDFLREALTTAELRGKADTVARLRLAEREFQAGGRRAMLDQLAASEVEAWGRGSGSAVVVAGYRALANDEAGLYKWLAIAEAQHDYNLSHLRADPEFSTYRGDPRFIAVLQRLP
jgi:tetratricopeptide (TPR) repeat protein